MKLAKKVLGTETKNETVISEINLATDVIIMHEAANPITRMRKVIKGIDTIDKKLRKSTKEMDKKWDKLSSKMGAHALYSGVAWAKKFAPDNKELIADAKSWEKFEAGIDKESVSFWKSNLRNKSSSLTTRSLYNNGLAKKPAIFKRCVSS